MGSFARGNIYRSFAFSPLWAARRPLSADRFARRLPFPCRRLTVTNHRFSGFFDRAEVHERGQLRDVRTSCGADAQLAFARLQVARGRGQNARVYGQIGRVRLDFARVRLVFARERRAGKSAGRYNRTTRDGLPRRLTIVARRIKLGLAVVACELREREGVRLGIRLPLRHRRRPWIVVK